MKVRVGRAVETVWEGNASSVSSSNANGAFDILPMHAHFLTIIEGNPIQIVTSDGKNLTFVFKQAVMHVKDDVVHIYGDIG